MVFPPSCAFCAAPLGDHSGCCAQCVALIHTWPRHHCLLCGRSLPQHLAPGPCGKCLHRTPPQKRTESLYIYDQGPVRNAILDWKLQGRDAGMLWLLDIATARLQTLFDAHSLLLPIPMPLSRMRRAGRHHATDLCRAIAERTEASVDWRVLRRNGAQQRQSSLSGRARWKNLCNAFRVDTDYWNACKARIADNAGDMRVWVVDDIMTTGATMHFACRALQRAGIQVSAFSLTRLPGRE